MMERYLLHHRMIAATRVAHVCPEPMLIYSGVKKTAILQAGWLSTTVRLPQIAFRACHAVLRS